TEVAHAVDEDAPGRVEAAHVNGITRRGAAVLADEEGAHAGAVAQRFGQRGRGLLLDDLLADDVDGLRRIEQRLRELRRLDRIDLVGDAFRDDVNGGQLRRGACAVGRCRRAGCERGQAQRNTGHQRGQGEGARAGATGTVLATRDALHVYGPCCVGHLARRLAGPFARGCALPVDARVPCCCRGARRTWV